MLYQLELLARLLSLAGLLFHGISRLAGWQFGMEIGMYVWVPALLCSFPIFGGRVIISVARHHWQLFRAKNKPVPEIVSSLATRFKISPPKSMKVIPCSNINAAVTADALYITRGFLPYLETQIGKGILAHELAHLAEQKTVQAAVITVTFGVLLIAGLVLLGDSSLTSILVVSLTIAPIGLPAFWKYREFEADARAAKIVGIEVVVAGLQASMARPRWNREHDTHPSIKRRVAKLRNQ